MIYKIAGSSSAVVLFIELLEMSKELVSYIMINNQPSQILIDPEITEFSACCVFCMSFSETKVNQQFHYEQLDFREVLKQDTVWVQCTIKLNVTHHWTNISIHSCMLLTFCMSTVKPRSTNNFRMSNWISDLFWKLTGKKCIKLYSFFGTRRQIKLKDKKYYVY